MWQYKGSQDTIVAVATASGAGGIALVRLSGPVSRAITAQIFRSSRGRQTETWVSHTVRHGNIVGSDGVVVDEVLVTYMKGPKSYTAEDVIEIGCHGGMVSSRAVVDLCIRAGARLAMPGEFTKRAFLNGRIDLAQAEAVVDVIKARTEAALRAGARQLGGALSVELGRVREEIMTALAGIEALLNFPEEDTDRGQVQKLAALVAGAQEQVEHLLATAQAGLVLREGVRVAIAGKPNAGKSSLLNAFLRQSRAIVTDIAGTTRDTLEETANVAGFPVNFVDTAGILEPRDPVEAEAVRRSHAAIDDADCVLVVLDRSRPLDNTDLALAARLSGNEHLIVVLNKIDLPADMTDKAIDGLFPGRRIAPVSLVTREGFVELETAVADMVGAGRLSGEDGVILMHARHVQALEGAQSRLTAAVEALERRDPLEMVSEDLKSAVHMLDTVTGRDFDADLIDRIFSEFCIGK